MNFSFHSGGTPFDLIVNASIKSTVVILLAMALVRCIAGKSAAARHLVLSLAMAVALLLPLVQATSPRWNLHVLSASALNNTPQANESMLTRSNIPVNSEMATRRQPIAVLGKVGLSQGDARGPKVARLNRESDTSSVARHPSMELTTLLIIVWGIGVSVVIAGWLIGLAAAVRLQRSARRVHSIPLFNVVANLRQSMGIPRQVSVHIGGRVTTPLTAGFARPALLLPSDCEQWPATQLRSVLIHELAHVKRFDCATQTLSQLVCALYWFNPLVWLASAQLRTERENACDDIVLRNGVDPANYADILLAFAKKLCRGGVADLASVAMARRLGLRDRVHKILHSDVNRHPLNRGTTVLAILTAGLALLPLAAIHLVSRSASAANATSRASVQTPTGPNTPGDVAASPDTDRMVIVSANGETRATADSGNNYPVAMNVRFRAPGAPFAPGPWFFLLNSDCGEPAQINPLKLGLPENAPIEEIVKLTNSGDIYQPTLGRIVPVRGSLMAPIKMPADNRPVVEGIKLYDFIHTMTREQIARSVLAYHHTHPDTTEWELKEGELFTVLRPDGGLSVLAIRGRGKDRYIFVVPIGAVTLAADLQQRSTTHPATTEPALSVAKNFKDGQAIAFDLHGAYIVSNKFEPDVAASFVVIQDQKTFDEVFRMVMMQDKNPRLKNHTFDTKIVLAVVKRGMTACTYKVQAVTAESGVLRMRYSTTTEAHPAATFASPLIVSIPKGDYIAVEFVEDGNVVKKIEMSNSK
jgi:beta-lactamase regulating signal transducer with metallopeptidase domain